MGSSEAGEAAKVKSGTLPLPLWVSAELVETFSPPSSSNTPAPHGLHGGTCVLGVSQLDNASGMRHVGWGKMAGFVPAGQCMEKKGIFLLVRNSAGMIT